MVDPNADGVPIVSTLSDDPDMTELIELFVAEMPEKIEQLTDLFGKQAFEDLRYVAHQMKGSCAGYGFESLGEAASRLDDELKKTTIDPQEIESINRELIALCRRVAI